MQKFLILFGMLTIVSCGNNEKQPTSSTEDIKPESQLLSTTLKNTRWEMRDFPAANITILESNVTVAMSETSFISNGNMFVLVDDSANNFVVFNVYETNGNNRVLAISTVDPETIDVSIIQNSNSIEGYKASHERFKVTMKKTAL